MRSRHQTLDVDPEVASEKLELCLCGRLMSWKLVAVSLGLPYAALELEVVLVEELVLVEEPVMVLFWLECSCCLLTLHPIEKHCGLVLEEVVVLV